MKKVTNSLSDIEVDRLVRISATEFNRRRRLTDKQIAVIKKLRIDFHMSWKELAELTKVDPRTVRYHCDAAFRRSRIKQARYPTKKSNVYDPVKIKDRIEYKRSLIAEGKITTLN